MSASHYTSHHRPRHFVFVSHCTDDKPKLKHLVQALMKGGVRIWIDKPDVLDLEPEDCAAVEGILPGALWREEGIHPALDQAACILVCFSKTALSGDHKVFWQEANFGLVKGNLVPCLIDDVAPAKLPSEFLARQALHVGLDVDPSRREAAISALRKGVRRTIDESVRKEAAGRAAERIPYEVNNKRDPLPDDVFTGRKVELSKIDRCFNSGGVRVAIWGMPGLGKTSLAAQYAHRYAENYHGVLWLGAERRADLVQNIAMVGKAMKPPVEGADGTNDEATARATLQRLDTSGDEILYVFDNVETPEDIEGLLPRSRFARVLITSKFPDWRKHVQEQINLELFTPPEAQRFLLVRTSPNDDWTGASDVAIGAAAVATGAAAVAEDVGYLPLMLEQAAAAYMLGTDFAAYRQSFGENYQSAPAQLESREARRMWASVGASLDTLKRRAETKNVEFERMLEFLAFCAADAIPPSLFEAALAKKAQARDAIAALMSVSLVKRASSGASSGDVSLHRMTQAVARGRAQQEGTAVAAFGRVVQRLEEVHPKDVTRENWEECAKLTPHLLSVVDLVREEWLEESGEQVDLDRLAKLVVLAILYAREEPGRESTSVLAAPERLVRVLGMFYEVEPLAGALTKLVDKKSDEWPSLRDQLLAHNNYVLRHALAQALADAVLEGKMPIERATELLVPGSTSNKAPGSDLNAFELGGYALNLIYANRPNQIDPKQLQILAEHRCYPGRSILGDLMLNLAFDDRRWPLHQFLPNDRFWRSKWDFIALDADAVEAAQAFMFEPRRRPEEAREAVLRDFDFFCEVEGWCRDLSERETQPEIAGLLRDYRILGRNPDLIRKAEEELRRSPHLPALMETLFAHPQWSVAEAAATVLARIAGLALKNGDRRPSSIITQLFDSQHWRVRYGAAEASYALRQHDNLQAFTEAVRRFYNDQNCKIRALCAEDLGATILSASGDERERLIWEFSGELAHWLKDEDCWVLEHVHRFFSELKDSESHEAKRLLAGPISRLFANRRDWPAMDREAFLRLIEDEKDKLAA